MGRTLQSCYYRYELAVLSLPSLISDISMTFQSNWEFQKTMHALALTSANEGAEEVSLCGTGGTPFASVLGLVLVLPSEDTSTGPDGLVEGLLRGCLCVEGSGGEEASERRSWNFSGVMPCGDVTDNAGIPSIKEIGYYK